MEIKRSTTKKERKLSHVHFHRMSQDNMESFNSFTEEGNSKREQARRIDIY